MCVFDISKEEIEFFHHEINQIIYKLERIQCKKEVNPLIKELSSFNHKLVVDENFNEGEYLDISKRIILKLMPLEDNRENIKLTLALSRVNSSLRDVYEELDLFSVLSLYLGENLYEPNDYNRVLIQDFQYSYYYYISLEFKNEGGVLKLLDFLNHNSNLLNNKNRNWIVRSIIETFNKSNLLSEDDISLLKSSLKCSSIEDFIW